MYLSTAQPVRRQRRRRTLGDDPTFWGNIWEGVENAWWTQPANLAKDVVDVPSNYNALVSSSPSNQFIPGSTASSYVANAITGQPTDAQIAYTTNQCVAAIQSMRAAAAANGQPGPPAGAESQCSSDQQAYTKLIGGTANTVLSPANLLTGVLPGGSDIGTWALVALAGIVGLMVLSK